MNKELFNADAEIAVLSIILKNPELINEIPNLKGFMFSSTPNILIFNTVKELFEQNLFPEKGLIISFLRSRNQDLEAGSIEYVNYIYNQDYSGTNVKEFERIIIDSYKARSLISLYSNLSVSDITVENVDKVINDAKQKLDNLTSVSGGDSTVILSEAVKDAWEAIEYRVNNPGIQGFPSGFDSIDVTTSGIFPGELWVIAGRPGMGKSALFGNMMLNQAKKNFPTLFFSLEMRKVPLIERLICMETGISHSHIRSGTLNQDQLNKISDSMRVMKNYPIYIDENFFCDLDYVISTIRKYHNQHGIRLAYIDYLQLLSTRGNDQTAEIGRITRSLKLLANSLDISIVLGSQLNRAVEMRDDKRPVASDLRQSGNIEEDADVIIGLYRDYVYDHKTKFPDRLESLFLKNRNGPTGTLMMKFFGETYKIEGE